MEFWGMNGMELKIALSLAAFAVLLIAIGMEETLRRYRRREKMRSIVEEQIHTLLVDCGWYDDDRQRNEVP